MLDPRRNIGTFAVLSLVLLRLVIGWHFFTEGLQKITYDSQTGEVQLAFTAAPFLLQAKGPLEDFFHSQAASGHNWQSLLAVPRQGAALSPDEVKARATWVSQFQRRRADAEKSGEVMPAEVPPFAPYHAWTARIADDWNAILKQVESIDGLSDEQKRAAKAAVDRRYQQLVDYLSEESQAVAEYQHQLWRLENSQGAPEADGVPFEAARIAKKEAETGASVRPWISQVDQFEQALRNDLRGILTSEQRTDRSLVAAVEAAQSSPQQKWLHSINWIVTVLTIGVGVCLLLGFFTRLASLAGALFLLGVIATQPPWVANAVPTINQAIEFVALLVLAGTGAGRWLGLDFFTYALFSRSAREAT